MRPIHVSVEVPRPAEEVFGFVADFENNPRWQAGMRSCRWTSPAPHGVGSTYDQVAEFRGKTISSSFVVVSHDRPRHVKIRSTAGPFPIQETRDVAAVDDDRSRVDVIVEGDASGFFRLAAPLLRLFVARSVRRDYRRLADVLAGVSAAETH